MKCRIIEAFRIAMAVVASPACTNLILIFLLSAIWQLSEAVDHVSLDAPSEITVSGQVGIDGPVTIER